MIAGIYSIVKMGLILTSLAIIYSLFFVLKADAATLTNASNTLSTSRPSASSPLNAALGATDTQATIFNNGSFYLASDSAKVIKTATGAIVDAATIVSSQSAALTTVFFAEQAGTAAVAAADVLYVPITAMHKIRFTIPTQIPDEGDVELFFPILAAGDADNDASPSATTFQFNNLVPGGSETNPTNIEVFDDAGNVTAAVTVTETEPTSGAGGRLTIEFDSGPIAAGSVITIFLGCSAASDQNTCTTQVPRVINPTKTANAGTADIWKINIQTEDGSDVDLDSSTVAIGTIETVTVRATVDPTLTFTISGVANGVDVSTGNGTGCLQDEDTNTGIPATATEVNLGLLANTPAADAKVGNIAAQLLSVTTNAPNGYAITATSSGQLINPSSGFFLDSSTTPTAFPSTSADWFGAHACGLDTFDGTTISTTYWNTAASDTACGTCIAGSTSCPEATGGTNICKYGWPTTTVPVTIAYDGTGPIGNSLLAGNGLTSMSYAAGADAGVPAGEYRTFITYVATPTF